MTPKPPPDAPGRSKMAPKSLQRPPKSLPVGHGTAPRGLQGSKWSQNGAQMAARAQNGAKKKPKWSPNGTQTVSTRVKNNENRTQLVSETRETLILFGCSYRFRCTTQHCLQGRPAPLMSCPKAVKRRNRVETKKITAHMKLQNIESEKHAPLKRRNPKNRRNRNL